MRLTPLEWGLRAPITPRLGGNAGRYRAWQNRSQPAKNKPTLNTKLRILPGFLTHKFKGPPFGWQEARF